ncbi:MAG: ABC transporter permease subunit, partial [Patulibacter sp.]
MQAPISPSHGATPLPGWRRRLHRAGGGLGNLALTVGGFAVVVGLWALVASASSAAKVAGPAEVFDAVQASWSNIPALTYVAFQTGGIGSALVYTTVGVVLAVLVGALVGLPLGIALSQLRLARLTVEPVLIVVGTVPLLVLLPFLTLWFGTSRIAQSALVAVFALLTVAFATRAAADAVPPHYLESATTQGASARTRLFAVTLPAAMPDAIGAVRLALAAGWGWQCVAELLGTGEGVGRVIQVTSRLQATADLFATLLCL